MVPESLGGQDCRIPVEKETLEALRAEIPVSREESMRWVDDEFATSANTAYAAIGSPKLVVANGWNVFQAMHLFLRD
jgi:hypothetical protein